MVKNRKDSAPRRASHTYRTGLWAEAFCRLFLRLKGYRILVSRCRTKLGEVDIIALRGNLLALVEVKARPSVREAAEAISSRQQERLQRAAAAFLGRNPRYCHCSLRFDAMLVAPWRWPVHIQGAWEGLSQ
ncbi:MAG: YraN family protein [Alphaproteobacteria bacterium]|nr:YraN family protein [Alphaproteobacteria bacterium]